MKQNHPTPGWSGRSIPATRGAPEKKVDAAWPTRDGPETRIRDGTELQIRDGTRVRIRDDTKLHIPFNPKGGCISADIAVGFSQRNRHTHVSTGLQPHQQEMRIEPGLPHCNLNRQLGIAIPSGKQTAINEKQMPMDNLHGSPNLQGFGNLKGLKNRCKARDPAGHAPEKVRRSGTGTKRAPVCQTGRPVCRTGRRDGADIAVGLNQRNRYTYLSKGLQPHQEKMRLEPDLPRFILIRQLGVAIPSGKQTAMEKQIPEGCLINAVRSNDADRFRDLATPADLSASARPDNVNKGKKNSPPAIQQNADPEGTSRFRDLATPADLSACAAPDNVNKGKKNPRI